MNQLIEWLINAERQKWTQVGASMEKVNMEIDTFVRFIMNCVAWLAIL